MGNEQKEWAKEAQKKVLERLEGSILTTSRIRETIAEVVSEEGMAWLSITVTLGVMSELYSELSNMKDDVKAIKTRIGAFEASGKLVEMIEAADEEALPSFEDLEKFVTEEYPFIKSEQFVREVLKAAALLGLSRMLGGALSSPEDADKLFGLTDTIQERLRRGREE